MTTFHAEQEEGDSNRFFVLVDEKFDVRIIRTDEGLVVDVYPYDGAKSVASTYAFDSDVESDEEAA